MLSNQQTQPAQVIGPVGMPLTIEDLPPLGARWTAHRKADVVVAVERGLLTMQEACDRYSISVEELAEWLRGFKYRGIKGLQTTRSQENREAFERNALQLQR